MAKAAAFKPRKATLINIMLVILIISISCVLGINYLLNTILPDKIATFAKDFAQTRLHKRIAISHIEVDLFRGINLHDVSLYTTKEKTPFLVIRRVQALPFYPSFLSNKKWFFSLTLDGVTFTLIRTKDGFNVPQMDKSFTHEPGLFINLIAIKNFDLTYQDAVAGFTNEFKHLFCVVNLSFPRAIHLQARWPEKVNIRGEFNLTTKQGTVILSMSDIDLRRLNVYSPARLFSKAYLEYASVSLSGKETYQLKINAGIKDFLGADNDSLTSQHIDLKLQLPGISPNEIIKNITNSSQPGLPPLPHTPTPLEGQLQMDKVLYNNTLSTHADRITTHLTSKDIHLPILITALLQRTSLPETIKVDASSQVQNFSLEKDGLRLSGNADILYQLPLAKEKTFITGSWHQGYVDLPGFGELKNIETDMELKPDTLSLKKIVALYKGQALAAQATIASFSNPSFYAEFEGTYPLTWIMDITPDLQRLKWDYHGDAHLTLQGKLKGNIAKRDFSYFVDFVLNSLSTGDVHDLQAQGYAQKDKIVINDAKLRYKKIPLTLKGSLENFESPQALIEIVGPNFWTKTRARVHKDSLDIQSLILGGMRSKITSKGTLDLTPRVSFNLIGSGTIDCEDLFAWRRSIEINNLLDNFNNAVKPIVPKFFSKFNSDNLKGSLDIKYIVKGGMDPDEWEIKLAGHSPSMQAFRVKILNPRIEFFKNKDELTISPLVCNVASGKLEIRTRVDFAAKKAKFDIVGNDLDLAQLRDQLTLKNKKLAGTLSFEAYIDNNSLSSWDKLDGEGKIQIKDGHVAELNLLRGLGEFLFIPDFDEIVFEEGFGDLYFRNNQIIVDNIALNSLQMNIKGGGKISLSGPIHFLLFPEFNPKLIAASDSLKKITTGLLGKALLVEILGTIEQPRYQVKPTILYPLNKIKSFFNELLN